MTSKDPYEPPSSDIRPRSGVAALPSEPPPFPVGMLRMAGMLSLLYLLLSIPSWASLFAPGLMSEGTEKTLTFVVNALSVYIIYSLIRFVDYRFRAPDIRPIGYTIISLGLVLSLLGLMSPPTADDTALSPMNIVAIVLLIPYGFSLVWLGIKLRRAAPGFRLMQSLGLLTILVGVPIGTVVLILLSLPFGLAWDVVAAMVFFAGARELEQAGFS